MQSLMSKESKSEITLKELLAKYDELVGKLGDEFMIEIELKGQSYEEDELEEIFNSLVSFSE